MTNQPRAARHVPVLAREVLQWMALAPGMAVLDGTVGAGGHSRLMWEAIQPEGRLLGIDRDTMMLQFARQQLPDERVVLCQGSYADMEELRSRCNFPQPDRILLDLGLSSDQLADKERGFGFDAGGPLDLRFDTSQGIPASEFLQTVSEDDLTAMLQDLAEEPRAAAIAREVVLTRQTNPLRTAGDLAQLCERVLGARGTGPKDRHPATRTFQALRITVNRELEHVSRGLAAARTTLVPGGLIGVITFHSLEDRLVKAEFRDESYWKVVTPKPIAASPAEQRFNPRSRSAKLRVAQRLPGNSAG